MMFAPVSPDEFTTPVRPKSRSLSIIEAFLESGMPIARITDTSHFAGVDSCAASITITAKKRGLKVRAFVFKGNAYIKVSEED